MSYDLYFRQKPETDPLTEERFLSYFSKRPHYQVDVSQARYNNEDTGVYFLFETCSDGELIQEEKLLPFTFNINYCRPHIFGLEAEPEVNAFISQFDLAVYNPQSEDIIDDPYSSDSFLKSWNEGNHSGYKSMFSQKKGSNSIDMLPGEQIETYWKWNLKRDHLQNSLEEPMFVPKIMFLRINGQIKSFVAWPDGIPITLPRVDRVLVARKKYAPKKRWLKQKDNILLTWKDIEPTIGDFPFIETEAYFRLNYSKPTKNIADLIRSQSPFNKPLQGIAPDSILNEELVVKYRKS